MAIWFKKWSNFDSARSLGEWIWWGFCQAFNITGAGVIAWLSSYWDVYWQVFNLAGYAIAFMISIIVLPIGVILVAEAKDRFIGGKAEVSKGKNRRKVTPASKDTIIDSAIVAAGIAGRPPEYRAKFGKSGRDGAFYLEYQSSSGGYGGGWTVKQVNLIQTVDRYIDGEQIILSLCGVVETREGPRWHWQPSSLGENGFPQYMIGINWSYRGRVRFVSSDDESESCYFVATTNDHSEMPRIIGEHMFAHIHEWEGGTPRNGNPRSLFR